MQKFKILIGDVTVELNSDKKTVEISKIFDDTPEKPGVNVSLLLTYPEFVGIINSLQSAACMGH